VTGQHGVVAQHDISANDAIVGDMYVGHEKTFLAHNGETAGLGGTIDGYMFPQRRARAYPHPRTSRMIEMQVLRVAADHGVGMHNNPVAKNGVAANDCACLQVAITAELRVAFDDRGGMNGGSHDF
jgi:hypothetical protein